MAERIGRGDYELGADRSKLKRDLKEAALDVLRSGTDAEGKSTTIVDRTLGKLKTMSAVQVGAIAGAAAGAAGVAAMKIGDLYDAAVDTIRSGTGKTGEALAGLEQSFKNVAGRVKEDIGVVASVLASLHSRTGLTGEALEAMTQRVIEFSRVTGTDAVQNTQLVTRLFGDWSIATEDQEGALDKLLRTSQATGIQVDRLMQTVVQFGAPLRLLGFSFEESIALLGKWEKEGVNTETMLTGLKFAVKSLANEGVPAADMATTLREKIEAIGKSTDPVSDAIKLFGLRAGPDLAAAILEGRFSVEDLMKVIEDGSETVEGLANDTRDAGDAIAELKNKVMVAIGPLVDGFAGFADSLGNAVFLLPALTGAIGGLTGKLWAHVAAQAAATGGWVAYGAAALAVLGPIALVVAAIVGLVWAIDDFNKKVAAGKANVETQKQSFLASVPTREEVEAAVAGLKAIPEKLGAFQKLLYEANAGGVKTINERSIAELEAYLAQVDAIMAQAATEGLDVDRVVAEFSARLAAGMDPGMAYATALAYGRAIPSGMEQGINEGGDLVFGPFLPDDPRAVGTGQGQEYGTGLVEGVRATLGGISAASEEAWMAFEEAPRQSMDAVRDRIEVLRAQLRELNEVDMASLGPEAFTAWSAARTATEQELGGLVEYVETGGKSMTVAMDKAADQIRLSADSIGSSLGGIWKSSNDAWRRFKDGTKDGADAVERRIKTLNERLDELNKVKLAELGPAALANWLAAKNATQTELGQLTTFVANKGDIIKNILPQALEDSQSAWVDEWGAILGLTKEQVRILHSHLGSWGHNAADNWTDNFTATIRAGKGDIRDALRFATRGMVATSPPEAIPELARWAVAGAEGWLNPFVGTLERGRNRVSGALRGYDFGQLPGLGRMPGRLPGLGDGFAPTAAAGTHLHLTLQIGTLIGDEAGIYELGQRIERVVGSYDR